MDIITGLYMTRLPMNSEKTSENQKILEDITGEPVLGTGQPASLLLKKPFWALDILKQEGFKYDSSIFPIRHDRYGIPGF